MCVLRGQDVGEGVLAAGRGVCAKAAACLDHVRTGAAALPCVVHVQQCDIYSSFCHLRRGFKFGFLGGLKRAGVSRARGSNAGPCGRLLALCRACMCVRACQYVVIANSYR